MRGKNINKVIGFVASLIVAMIDISSVSAHQISITAPTQTSILIEAGTTSIAVSPVRIQTDCRTGYTLSIKGPTDVNLYLNGDDTKNEVGKYLKPVTGASVLNTQSNAYGYSLGSDSSSSIFQPLTNNDVIIKDSTTTGGSLSDIDETTNLYWGAYVDQSPLAGIYKLSGDGAVTYQAVTSPTCSIYTVEFNANGGGGAMSPQQIISDTPTQLSPNTFTAENAKDGFLGWNTKADGTGIRYSNEQTVTNLVEEGKTITLYAQWGCPANTICYDDNGANSVTKMGNQATASATTILWATNFQRQGYGFLGWGKNSDGSGTMYGPNQTVDTSDLGYEGLKLYAIWKQSEGNLQNWQGCESLAIGGTTALTDTRDNQTYAIARLQDGNCWMIENMRLNDSATMTATDTDNPAISKLWSTSVSDSYGCWYESSTACVNRPLMSAISTENPVSEMTTSTNVHIYSYGNSYSWNAATAGRGVYDTVSTDATGSICPIGWKLPLGNTNRGSGSYSYLDIRLGGTGSGGSDASFNNAMREVWRSYPNNFVMSGMRNRTGFGSLGSKIMLNTATASNFINRYGIDMQGYSGGNYAPGNGITSKSSGLAVRCVIKIDDLYFIDFDANGGSGEMTDQLIKTGVSTDLSANQFTAPKSWQVFKGWNAEPDGTGTSYSDGQSVSNLVGTGQTLTLYAQWGCPANTICYDDSGAESPTKMGLQQDFTSASEIKLWPSNFKREGYGFAGWNTKPDDTGTMYGPVETISDSAKVSNIKTNGMALYATWVQSAGDLQGWNGCEVMNIGDVTALTDKRDNQTYAVAKLSDGKCWMIENLRLDNQYTIGEENKALSQGYADNFIGLADPESRNFSSTSVANSLYSTDGSTAVTITYATPDALFPRYNNQNTADAINNLTSWTGAENVYSLGNYYTWAAAVASTTPHNNNNAVVSDTSICPASWRLPMGGDKNMEQKNEPWQLIVTHLNNGVLPNNYETAFRDRPTFLGDGAELQKVMATYPNNFIYAGIYQGNKLEYRNAMNHSWTSTVGEAAHAYSYGMVSFSKSVSPGTAIYNKYYGLSIRCIFNPVFTVEFDANGGSGDMPNQAINTGVPTKLSANTFTPPNGKVFAGWNTASDGSGTTYANEASVTDLVATDQSITLYAQWGVTLEAAYAEAGMTKHNGYYKMQDMNSAICDATTIIGDGSRMTAIDTRDNKTYIITKLADGRCWMVQNLALGGSSSITLTPQDSNVITDFVLEPSTSGRFWINANTTNAANINLNRMHDNGNDWIDSDNKSQTSGTPPSPTQYVGNNYNWYTATAGTGTYEMNTDGANATSSVCPKGWRLPTATAGDGEFKKLYDAYGNNVDLLRSAFSAIYYGMWDSNNMAPGNRGIVGSWWSSTVKDSGDVWHAWIDSTTGFAWRMYHRKYAGYSVRCIAQEGYTVTFDANGGSGDMPNQIIYTDVATKLNKNDFVMPTWADIFEGWNTNQDGSGTFYDDEEEILNLASASSDITLYAQWSCAPEKICYNANGIKSATRMADQNAPSNSEVDLRVPNFKRDGYGFAGWNTAPDGTGTDYGPNETITVGDLSAKGMRLYANWVASSGTIQNWNGCATLGIGKVTALTDTRDNQTYAVAKLADGKCWMVENLRLGGNNPVNLTSSDTAINNSITLPVDNFPVSNTCGYSDICVETLNTTKPTLWMTSHNENAYGYGNYYSNSAALATTALSDTNNTRVTTSICPKGWRLPSGGDVDVQSSSEFYNMVVSVVGEEPNYYFSQKVRRYDNEPALKASRKLRTYPNNFVFSGSRSARINNRGTHMTYWSNTLSSPASSLAKNSYAFSNNSTVVYPGTTSPLRSGGFPVRCMIGN